MKQTVSRMKQWLQGLSFRTGVIVLCICIPCYILSFAQMLLPISQTSKGALWVVFFGLAKTFQYGSLTILGVDGYKRLKNKFGHHHENKKPRTPQNYDLNIKDISLESKKTAQNKLK